MTPGNLIETQFALYLQSQSPKDLAPVLEALRPQLMGAARRAGLDPQGAEDAVQETFLGVIEARDRFDSDKPFIPWVRGIALRQIRAERRRRARLQMLFRSDDTQVAGDDLGSETLNSKELQDQIHQALQALSKGNQEVVSAALFDGLSIEGLSQRFDLTKSATSVRLHRGLRQLRERLEAMGTTHGQRAPESAEGD